MPFYEYQCTACNTHVEVLQKISDAPLRKCPQCGKQKLQRLLSAPVFRLKGSGWYETDFKSDNEAKRNLADQPGKDAKDGVDATATPAETAATDTKDAAKPVEAKPAPEPKATSTTASKTRKPIVKARPKPRAKVAPSKRKAAKR